MLQKHSASINSFIEKLKTLKSKEKDFNNDDAQQTNYIYEIINLYDNLKKKFVMHPETPEQFVDFENFRMFESIIYVFFNLFCGVNNLAKQSQIEEIDVYYFYETFKSQYINPFKKGLSTAEILNLLK